MSRNYSNWINQYLEYTQYSEAPDEFHWWVAVSVLSGAIRRQVWLEMGYWQWVPNFYICLVAPPGIVSKSFSTDIGMRLLKQVEGIDFGPSSVTWQKLVMQMSSAAKVFTTRDGRILTQSAMTVVASEFGTMIDPEDRTQIDIFVDLWDAKPGNWTKANVGLGEFNVRNPCLNMIACTTPSWIANAFPEYLIGGGFTSRTIFVYADRKRQYVAYPKMQMNLPEQEKMKEKLIQDLAHIAKLGGEITMTPQAYALGDVWYEDFFANRPAHLNQPCFEGYIARKQTHIHKVAMILSIAESDDLIITEDHLAQAIEIVGKVELNMPKVFGNIGLSHAGKKQNILIQFLKTNGEINLIQLYQLASKSMSYEEFNTTITDLTQAKQIRFRNEKGAAMISLTGL
jgi:hypothetical protein